MADGCASLLACRLASFFQSEKYEALIKCYEKKLVAQLEMLMCHCKEMRDADWILMIEALLSWTLLLADDEE